MAPLGSIVFAAALLLIFSGFAKLRTPQATATALRQVRPLPVHVATHLARALGCAEIALAAGAFATGNAIAVLALAAAFAGFALFTGYMLSTGKSRDCGCFGQASAPLSAVHVVVDGALAAALIAAAVKPPGPVTGLLDEPLSGVPLALLIGLQAYVLFLALTALPTALAATRSEARA